MSSSTIALSGEQFKLLLQRAQIKAKNPDTVSDGFVRIVPNDEWENLQARADQHTRLCRALIEGGVEPSQIELLIGEAQNDDTESSKTYSSNVLPTDHHENGRARRSFQACWDNGHHLPLKTITNCLRTHTGQSANLVSSSSSQTEFCDDASSLADEHIGTPIEKFENDYEPRSLIISGISDHTTLKDIMTVVRGGMILKAFIRRRDNVAHVTFVLSNAAERFFNYAKKNDIYLRSKRVRISWDKKQYYLSGHIASRIFSNGATRNIIIRQPKSDMTAENIRNDLEHIDRLEIVSITKTGADVLISTNSVQLAIVARTCMYSQLRYRGSQIGFAPDECDQEIPQVARKERAMQPAQRVKQNPLRNRFQLLSIDDTDGGEEASESGVE